MENQELDFTIERLGDSEISSPLKLGRFIADDAQVLYNSDPVRIQELLAEGKHLPSLELAGPREKIYFDSSELHCGMVTCGGICPGLNDVIRAVTMSLYYHYGVKFVHGFQYGFEGLVERYGHKVLPLTPETVKNIHDMGGTILGSSRGEQDVHEMVDFLEKREIGILFTIGGDGTLRGAQALVQEI
jgi:6-phosphofructokinase 1